MPPHNGTVHVFISWTFVYTFDIEQTCRQQRIRIHTNSSLNGILIGPNGKMELHCGERSFGYLRVFQAAPQAFDNIAELLPCFGQSIEVMILSKNIIGQLDPAEFDHFVLLQRLHLRDTMLTEFDVNNFQNQHRLFALDLSQNSLKRVDNISKLVNLQEFDGSQNLIENIPEIIGELPRTMTFLDVSDNLLGSVNQTTFQHLPKLQSLRLSHTALSFNDFDPFQPLEDLLFLDISRNNLSNTNFDLLDETLRKLISFNASHCHIGDAAKLVRKMVPHLERLDLSGNTWSEWNADILEWFTNLEVLNLSHTRLSTFDAKLFWSLNKLSHLDLSFNKLKQIDLELLSSRVEWLNLEGNDLVKIEHFAPRQKIQLGISKNQLMCTDIKRIKHNAHVILFGDATDQKHQHDCKSASQSISDFLSTAFNKVSFW